MERLVLQEQFDRIIDKYRPILVDLQYTAIQLYIRNRIWKESKDSRIAIWGAGEHTLELFKLIEDKISVVAIVDTSSQKIGTEIKGIRVNSPEFLQTFKVDKVVISSFSHRHEIRSRLLNEFDNIEIIDLYDIYDRVFPKDSLSPFYIDEYTFTKYPQEFRLYQYMIEHEIGSNLELYCKSYLSLLLHLKEFDKIDVLVREIIRNDLPNSDLYEALNSELQILLRTAQMHAGSRTCKDIFIFIPDSMRMKDIQFCSFLTAFSRQAITFDKAFSPSTYTHASFVGMFTGSGKDGQNYHADSINGEESSLFRFAINNNYEIYQSGGHYISNIPNLNFITNLDRFQKNIPLSTRWWEVLCRLCNSSRPQFHLIHILETHSPFLCAEHLKPVSSRFTPYNYYNNSSDKHTDGEAQYHEVLRYLDKSLESMVNTLSKNSIVTICSDHGGGTGGDEPTGHVFTCYENDIHVPFMIRLPSAQPCKIEKLFSMSRFDPMLASLLESGEIDDNLFTTHVYTARRAVYKSEWILNDNIRRNAGEWIHGFKMLRSSEFKYISFETGRELLYKLPNEKEDLSKKKDYEAVLGDLRARMP